MNIYVEAPWTWKEYDETTFHVTSMLREVAHPRATVVNVANLESLPRDGNPFHALLNRDKLMPENVFASVIVGAPCSVSVFMNMLMKLRPWATRLALSRQTMAAATEKS